MSTAGPTGVNSGTSAAGVNVAWTNPGNVTTDDSNYAVASLSSGTPDSNQLVATYNGFSIGATDTIQGFTATVKRKRGGSGSCNDLHVYLVIAGVTQTSGSDLASGTNWSATDETVTYGGVSNVWGQSAPVGATINGVATGVAIQAHRVSTNPDASLQYITMTITYTVAGSGTILRTSFNWDYKIGGKLN